MEKDQNVTNDGPVKKTESVVLKKQSSELSKVEEPGKPKKKAKRPAVRGGKPVGRKHLKREDPIGGDAMRDVYVPGTIDEVG